MRRCFGGSESGDEQILGLSRAWYRKNHCPGWETIPPPIHIFPLSKTKQSDIATRFACRVFPPGGECGLFSKGKDNEVPVACDVPRFLLGGAFGSWLWYWAADILLFRNAYSR